MCWSVFVASLTLLAATPAAAAEAFPTKPLRIFTVLPAGTDGYVRAVAGKLGDLLGQPVVVENRVGAGGTIGSALVAKAEADGYTLLAHGSGHVIAPALYRQLPYSPTRDFAAVARAFGAFGQRVTDKKDLDGAIKAALASGGPALVDVVVSKEAQAPSANRDATRLV